MEKFTFLFEKKILVAVLIIASIYAIYRFGHSMRELLYYITY